MKARIRALAAALGLLLASNGAPCHAGSGPASANAINPFAPSLSEAPTPSPGLSLESSATEFEKTFPFEYGIALYRKPWSGFDKGDKIVVRAIRGNRDHIEVGGLYAVMGSYTLTSMDKALLGLFITTRNVGVVPYFRHQMSKISKGSGTFLLWYQMTVDGDPHVSFYPASKDSEAHGGVYFEETDSNRRYAQGSADNRAEPVFKYYLPKSGQVKIGQPIFMNFMDGQAPR